jgi:hypothetical protein
MKRIAILAMAVAAALVPAIAQETEGAEAIGSAGQASGFSLTGSAGARISLAVGDDASIFVTPPAANAASAVGMIDGKLSFSRNYSALGLLDFSFSDSMAIDHDTGSTLETPAFAINELYADLNLGDALFFRLGKQRLSWGTGFVFNPSDPVNPPKDPTASRSVREGVPALKAELISERFSLMAFSVLHDEAEELGYGAKLSTSAIPNSDIALSGYWSPSQSWTAALNASIAPFYDFPGWDTIQLWFEGGMYDEARYAAYAEGSPPGSAVIAAAQGAQYAVLGGMSAQVPVLRTMFLAEYYHLSEGLSRADSAAVHRALGSSDPAIVGASSDWFAELARRPARLGRDYLFASLRQPSITDSGDPVLDKIGLSASCLVNLTDLSLYATGGLSLGIVDDASIDLNAAWFAGNDKSEFGNAPDSLSFSLEMKVFF